MLPFIWSAFIDHDPSSQSCMILFVLKKDFSLTVESCYQHTVLKIRTRG